ncbi:MAG: hypothetical protein ABIQ89_02725 [Candidatus Saccharimonadales bacterium]
MTGPEQLSQTERLARFDYSKDVPVFDENWYLQGWRPVIGYQRLNNDREFNHSSVTIQDALKTVMNRSLPYYVEHHGQSAVSEWYVFTDHLDGSEPLDEAILADSAEVYKDLYIGADKLQQAGLIAVRFAVEAF